MRDVFRRERTASTPRGGVELVCDLAEGVRRDVVLVLADELDGEAVLNAGTGRRLSEDYVARADLEVDCAVTGVAIQGRRVRHIDAEVGELLPGKVVDVGLGGVGRTAEVTTIATWLA